MKALLIAVLLAATLTGCETQTDRVAQAAELKSDQAKDQAYSEWFAAWKERDTIYRRLQLDFDKPTAETWHKCHTDPPTTKDHKVLCTRIDAKVRKSVDDAKVW